MITIRVMEDVHQLGPYVDFQSNFNLLKWMHGYLILL